MLLTETAQKLTASQARELERTRTFWTDVGFSTHKTDKTSSESAVIEAYMVAGLKPPSIIIWLKSPRAGANAVALLKSDIEWPEQLLGLQRQVWDDVWRQSVKQIEPLVGTGRWHEIRKTIRQEATKRITDLYGQYMESQVKAIFAERLGITAWQHIRKLAGATKADAIRNESELHVRSILEKTVPAELRDLVFQELVPPIRQQLGQSIAEPLRLMVNNGILTGRQTSECCYGQHDASWLSYYDFFRRNGTKGTERLDSMITLAQSCGWWWPYENLCILTERPLEMHRDNRGRLHNEHGMALQYGDGWGLYAWHGIVVPENVIRLTEAITLETIEAEPNIEVRRVLIERFGLDNYLKAGQAVKLHQDKTGTLYRMNLRGDEPILVVQVINSTPEPDGTFNEYFLRVPPTMTRARQAVAWTFGLSEEEYYPLAET